MKEITRLIDLERLKGREFRIDDLPYYFPKFNRSLVLEAGVKLVFRGTFVPGNTPGRYTPNK